MTIPVDDILDDLDLSRGEAGAGYLERLFLRFNERVPFETASKILRDATVSDPAKKPREPEVFWEERLSSGTGGTCFARVAAFEALARELGFVTRRALGRVREDGDHAALFVDAGGQPFICDVGFPLPALLPARPARIDTATGALLLEETARGWRIRFDGGVPAGPREVEVFGKPVDDEEYLGRWRATFRTGSNFLTDVVVHRLLENRRITFVRGAVRVDDLHSRTWIPLPAPREAALEELFGVDAAVLRSAFALRGDPDPESPAASIEVFLESPVSPQDAFDAIASPEGYARLLEGVGDVSTEKTAERAWRARLTAEGTSASLEESVEADPQSRTVSVRRSTGLSFFAAEERNGEPWLVRRAVLEGPRQELLRNDSLRGRMAGALAVDLLAWARRLATVDRR